MNRRNFLKNTIVGGISVGMLGGITIASGPLNFIEITNHTFVEADYSELVKILQSKTVKFSYCNFENIKKINIGENHEVFFDSCNLTHSFLEINGGYLNMKNCSLVNYRGGSIINVVNPHPTKGVWIVGCSFCDFKVNDIFINS